MIVSLCYEVVFACFLRADTPEEALDALRWHLGLLGSRPASLDDEAHSDRLLCPDPASSLPGRDVASLQPQPITVADTGEAPEWGLYSRKLWSEDSMEQMATIMELLAPHIAAGGYGGYFREEHASEATAFTFAVDS